MDPVAALHGAANALQAHNMSEAAEHLFAYYQWCIRGGNHNSVMDAQAVDLSNRLVEMLGEVES